jgi:hypothetical protein
LLADLEAIVKTDNVHFMDVGYWYLSNTIVSAIEGVIDGSLTKSKPACTSQTGSGGENTGASRRSTFFWRGFSSPVGVNKPAAKQYYQPNAKSKFGGGEGGRASGGHGGGGSGSQYSQHSQYSRGPYAGRGGGRGSGRGGGGPLWRSGFRKKSFYY